MILSKIQRALSELYQLGSDYSVEDFYLKSPIASADQILGHREGHEALYIQNNPDALNIGLYIDPAVIGRLEESRPFELIRETDLADFCVAVEGVSHFLYLVERAGDEKEITQLEMELQAEVDKYLLLALLHRLQTGAPPNHLMQTLFEDFHWRTEMSQVDLERYQEAHRLAAKFCASLDQQYVRPWRWQALIEKARRFYQASHWEKIRWLTP